MIWVGNFMTGKNDNANMSDTSKKIPKIAESTYIKNELGKVSYIFADKTGTLTSSIMVLKKFSNMSQSYNLDWSE